MQKTTLILALVLTTACAESADPAGMPWAADAGAAAPTSMVGHFGGDAPAQALVDLPDVHPPERDLGEDLEPDQQVPDEPDAGAPDLEPDLGEPDDLEPDQQVPDEPELDAAPPEPDPEPDLGLPDEPDQEVPEPDAELPVPDAEPEPECEGRRFEVCDGIDNDCDGEVDEGTDGDECGGGEGMCYRVGITVCRGAPYRLDCDMPPPQYRPVPERCGNDRDDDCDGQLDEGCR